MKRAAILTIALCLIATAALAGGKPPAKSADQVKSEKVITSFLTSMDQKKYDAAFALVDFDALLKDQLKTDPAKMKPDEKKKKIDLYKNMIKNMFEQEKKTTKFKNFSFGAIKKTGNTATLELINTPPKGSKDKPIVKTFKLSLAKDKCMIYGIGGK